METNLHTLHHLSALEGPHLGVGIDGLSGMFKTSNLQPMSKPPRKLPTVCYQWQHEIHVGNLGGKAYLRYYVQGLPGGRTQLAARSAKYRRETDVAAENKDRPPNELFYLHRALVPLLP